VYLNGAEVARGHMPAGRSGPLALAEDYPREAFIGSDGAPLPPPPERGPVPPSLQEAYRRRFRTLRVDLPAASLRQGTNVLALELHRAALPAELGAGTSGTSWNPSVAKNIWGTCGLEGVSLAVPPGREAALGAAPAPAVQVWTCDSLVRVGVDVESAGPLEPLRPARLAAPRNGVSSRQVVVSSSSDLANLSAALGDLKTDSGAVLGAGCVQVRYATLGDSVPRLLARPTLPARTVPIFLTARVPRDAAPGVYRGTLSIAGLARPAAVPVELTVYRWVLPDLRDFGTSVSLLHCPEAIARHYNVPLWSEEHFKRLGHSMALMGYAGNRLLSISAIGEHWFGDHPVIVFRKEGAAYVPDLRFARRYLELYNREAGQPRFLSVEVWNYAVSRRGFGRDGGSAKWMCDTIKVRLLEGDRLVPAEMPVYTRPGTQETWAAVAGGVKQIAADLGWTKTRLLWGTGGDNLPTEEIATFFKRIAPDMHWRVVTHGGSVYRWGLTPEERSQAGGVIVGYANLVRRNVTRKMFVPDCPLEVLKRDGVSSQPSEYLGMSALGRIAACYSGCGFLTFDAWATAGDGDRRRSPLGAYVGFGNIHPSGGAFVAPAADGAAPSPQLEALREGLQVTEAALHLRAALADPKRTAALRPGLAAEAAASVQALLDVMESNRRLRPVGTADVWPLIRRVYELVSEVEPAKGPSRGAGNEFYGRPGD
jgi:hypothetical protein